MPKRSRRRSRTGASPQKRKARGRTVPTTGAVAAQGAASPQAVPLPHPILRAPQSAPSRARVRDYSYVLKEVRRIAFLSAGILILMIVLAVVLR